MPAALAARRLLGRRLVGLLVALTLGLMCALAFTGSTGDTSRDQSAMDAMSMTNSGPATEDGGVLASVCDGMCATDQDACMAVGTVGVLTLLGLLLGGFRDTFLRLAPRAGSVRQRCRIRWHQPQPSLVQLCVLRV